MTKQEPSLCKVLEAALQRVELSPSPAYEVDCHTQACAFVHAALDLAGCSDAEQARILSRLFGWRIEQEVGAEPQRDYRCRVHYDGHAAGPWAEVRAESPRIAALLFVQRDFNDTALGGHGVAPVEVVDAEREGRRFVFQCTYQARYAAKPLLVSS